MLKEFNINQDSLQFVSVVLEFLLMSWEQLGFDLIIIMTGTEQYIKIEKDECTEEGELLQEAMMKRVKNVMKYYHHETIHIDVKVDNVLAIQKGLSILMKDEKGGFKATVQCSMSQRGQKSQGSTTGQKKPIYQNSLKAVLLTALAGCIEGYMSLHDEAGLIQCDVSPQNLMVNEDKDNSSWPAFLIDLDLAIRVQRDASSGAWGKTGTRAFMAIGVLYSEKHCFMHDLESFFWVLFWIYIHYDSPGKGSTVKWFEKWNYMSTEELAAAKQGVISEESDFLRIAEDYFTLSYQSLISCVNRLQQLVFPNSGWWKKENSNLSRNMIETLQDGENDPNIVN
ncbi:hypothetical protein, variant [Blastomyces dermatitidis ATCC 26199]|nr:hypothetical protein BDFG_05792 [Blastomyces dermatitidis ATCC 26199]EQL31889.1 hypothetical protein, variant [Blastomyces dermatitidis ATCC 26199]